MLTGTDLKVGQRIRLYHRPNKKEDFADGTIVPRTNRHSTPLFESDVSVEWLHCGDTTDATIHRYWFMHHSYREGMDFEIIQPIKAIDISELI